MTPKTIKIIVWSTVIIGAGVGSYLYFRGRSNKRLQDDFNSSDEKEVEATIKEAETKVVINPVSPKGTTEKGYVSYGDKTANVGVVQKYLNKKYKAGLAEDYIFGDLTLAALRKYEKVNSVSSSKFLEMGKYLKLI